MVDGRSVTGVVMLRPDGFSILESGFQLDFDVGRSVHHHTIQIY